MDRAFAASIGAKVVQREKAQRPRASSERRDSTQVAGLAERLYDAVCARPGAGMTVLGAQVGASARELYLPITLLKRAGRVRSVGARHATRYFPMASEAAAAE